MPLHYYDVLQKELVQRINLQHAVIEELEQAAWLRDRGDRHDISQCANHVSPHTASALATLTKIMELLNQAGTAATLNTTLLTVREARHCVEELYMQLNHGTERGPETTSYRTLIH
jgi:hypothetical protein